MQPPKVPELLELTFYAVVFTAVLMGVDVTLQLKLFPWSSSAKAGVSKSHLN